MKERLSAVVLFGVDLKYVMAGCLAINLITDIVTLKGFRIFTTIPLFAGLFYHLLHGTPKEAGIALAIPFIFNFIRFVTRRLALYDILELGMVGVIMGWPFGLVATLGAKALQALVKDTWITRLLGRKQGEGVYAFPYMIVIVPAVILSYCLFMEFRGTDKAIRNIVEPLIRWMISFAM